jgi:hypothetical protein
VATLVLIALLCAGAYGYWVSQPLPSATGPSVSITSTPLQFSLALDKTNYATTDNLTLYFSLRNISNRTVTVTLVHSYSLGIDSSLPPFRCVTSTEGASTSLNPQDLTHYFHFHFRFVDGNGTVIYDTTQLGLFESGYDIHLAPNGQVNQTLYISIPYFLSQPITTGTYEIRGILYDVYIDGGASVTIETPSIALAIQ